MPLELTCRACGRAYVPTHADVVAGPAVYRRCPSCRTPDPSRGAEPVVAVENPKVVA